jgi:spore coat protein U-like protein
MIRRFALASAILIAAASATPAMAGTATSNLQVSATVSASCALTTTALDFGNYDPTGANSSSGNHLEITGSLTTNCSSGTVATITLSQGSNPYPLGSDASPIRMLKNNNNVTLVYYLYSSLSPQTTWGNTASTGVAVTGTGSAVTTTIYGRIAKGQTVPTGSYTDTVVATVTY